MAVDEIMVPLITDSGGIVTSKPKVIDLNNIHFVNIRRVCTSNSFDVLANNAKIKCSLEVSNTISVLLVEIGGRLP